jgi:hypothetical protein
MFVLGAGEGSYIQPNCFDMMVVYRADEANLVQTHGFVKQSVVLPNIKLIFY